MGRNENVVSLDRGLVKDDMWKEHLDGFETGLVVKIRKRLLEEVPGLAEKFNSGQNKYFGYKRGNARDSFYIYVQKKGLLIDVCIPRDFEVDLKRAGFSIKHRENFQGRAGWITGWRVPHDWEAVNEITKWLRISLVSSGK